MNKDALIHLLYDLIAEPEPEEVEAPQPVRLILVNIVARGRRPLRAGLTPMDLGATAHPVAPNVWDLASPDGSPDIPLPAELALRCYGRVEPTVRLTLHRVAVADDLYEPQLEVTPAPVADALTLTLTFADGVARTLTVPKPRGKRSSAWSQTSEPLPAKAFGAESWPLDLGVPERHRGEMHTHRSGM